MAEFKYRRARANRRGSALIASLFVVIAVSVMSVAYLQLSLSKNREGRSAVDAKRAFYMAEAGLSESFTAIRMGRSGNVGTAEEPALFANGVYWVIAEEQEDETCLLTSTGLSGSGRSCLTVVVDKTESSVQSLGVFGDDDVTIGQGALVDSYDSRLGPYGDQGYDPGWYEARQQATTSTGSTGGATPIGGGTIEIGWMPGSQVHGGAVGAGLGGPQVVMNGGGGAANAGTVSTTDDAANADYDLNEWADTVEDMQDVERLPRSSKISGNGDITIYGAPPGSRRTRVLGDLRPGPEGTVTTESGTLVSGSSTPAEERTLLPVPEVPDLPDQGDKTLGRAFLLSDTEAAYGTFQAPAGTALILRGPLKLTFESLIIEAGAQIHIDTTAGPIEIYTTQYLGLEEGSQVVSISEEPSEAVFIVPASTWVDRDGDGVDDSPTVLEAQGQLHAVVFAPHSDVSIDSDLEYFGSLAARNVSIEANAKVHFDVALETVAGGPLSIPKLAAWRMIDLPDEPIVRQRVDPILWLKARGVTPPKSDQAYKDEWLEIQFICLDGHTHDYEGPRHLFRYRYVATTISETITTPPAGRMDPPETDYMEPIYGHAEAENDTPFMTVP